MKKLWEYQKERFPIFAHGLLIFSFSFSAICLSSLLRDQLSFPSTKVVLISFVCSFVFFLQLRIADEFKDYEEDLKFRPYRPVQRGLVTLKELAILGIFGGIIQVILAFWLYPKLLIILLIVWGYLALMSKEFFVSKWLITKPITYMSSHMIIIPFIDFFVTACDWYLPDGKPPSGLIWFILLSFCNGLVIEIGRKIRSPKDEEKGVQTYTHIWGIYKSVTIFIICLILTAFFACILGLTINFFIPILSLMIILILIGSIMGIKFIVNPIKQKGKQFEIFSGIWTILLYMFVGILPLIGNLIK